MIHVKVRVAEVPIEVIDPIVFQRVITKVLEGGGTVKIGVQGTVDAEVGLLVGEFTVRGIPVDGIVEVEGIYPFDDLQMGLVGDIDVASTTRSSITLTATVCVKNPTKYEAFVPYLNLHLLYEGYMALTIVLTTDISLETRQRSMRPCHKVSITSLGS